MAGRTFQLLGSRLSVLRGIVCAQLALECIEHLGNMIIELRTRDGRASSQLRVAIDRPSPSAQYLLAARSQVRSQRIQLIDTAWGKGHE
ncbi:MAG: hypothetical protein ABIP18_14210 [Steroidobacteraceae bacterium]